MYHRRNFFREEDVGRLSRWEEREVQGGEVLIRIRLEKVEFLQEKGSVGESYLKS